MGTLYVLEGSSLGARMIFRHVRQLGLDERHGARHLSKQADAATNWREFLLLLERFECTAPAALAAAANAAFSSAERAMSEADFGQSDVNREREPHQL
jgi:heme oxygenase